MFSTFQILVFRKEDNYKIITINFQQLGNRRTCGGTERKEGSCDARKEHKKM